MRERLKTIWRGFRESLSDIAAGMAMISLFPDPRDFHHRDYEPPASDAEAIASDMRKVIRCLEDTIAEADRNIRDFAPRD